MEKVINLILSTWQWSWWCDSVDVVQSLLLWSDPVACSSSSSGLSSSSSVQCWASSSSSCGLLLELGLVKWPFSWSLAGGFWFWDYSCDGLMNLCKKVREWSVVRWFASQAPAATPLSLSQLGSSPLCWQHKHNQWLSCLGTCLHGILFIPVWLLAVVLPVLNLFFGETCPSYACDAVLRQIWI